MKNECTEKLYLFLNVRGTWNARVTTMIQRTGTYVSPAPLIRTELVR